MDPDDVSAGLLDKAIDDLVDAHFTRYIDGILSRITTRIQKRVTRREREARFPEKSRNGPFALRIASGGGW